MRLATLLGILALGALIGCGPSAPTATEDAPAKPAPTTTSAAKPPVKPQQTASSGTPAGQTADGGQKPVASLAEALRPGGAAPTPTPEAGAAQGTTGTASTAEAEAEQALSLAGIDYFGEYKVALTPDQLKTAGGQQPKTVLTLNKNKTWRMVDPNRTVVGTFVEEGVAIVMSVKTIDGKPAPDAPPARMIVSPEGTELLTLDAGSGQTYRFVRR